MDWCKTNHFELNDETRAHLLTYASMSPIFMAAKYDVSRALATGQLSGDGAPVLITMPVAHPWVPLEILANAHDPVNADLFLLTDMPLHTGGELFSFLSPEGQELPGAPGFQVVRQEPMNASLFHDLSTDKNMGWVPSSGWLTYLHLGASSDSVTYDMTVTAAGTMRLASFGTSLTSAAEAAVALAPFQPTTPVAGALSVVIAPMALIGVVVVFTWRRRSRRAAVR